MSIDEKIVRMLLETSSSNVNEIVIYPAIKRIMKKLVNKLQNKRVHGRVYNGTINGVKVSIIRSMMGCPNTAMDIECLRRCKTQIIIRLDVCGGIGNENNQIQVGDTLIANSAYCGDGTSPHYLIKYPEILAKLNSIVNPISQVQEIKAGNQNVYITNPDDKLKSILSTEGVNNLSKRVKEVDFWTTDAMFCETDDFIDSLKSNDIQGIDMENSILFLLGKIFDLKTASILSVTDLPGDPKYDMFKTNEIHPDLEIGMDNVVKVLIQSLPKIKALVKVE